MHNVDTIIGIIVQDVDVESVHNLINTIRTDKQFPLPYSITGSIVCCCRRPTSHRPKVPFYYILLICLIFIFIGILPYMKNVYRYPLILVGEYWSDKKGTRYYQKITTKLSNRCTARGSGAANNSTAEQI